MIFADNVGRTQMRRILFCVMLTACGDDAVDSKTPTLTRCTGRAFTSSAPGDFEHLASDLISKTDAEHGGFDVLAAGPNPVAARAKFHYEALKTFKDLEDEEVRVFYDDCTGWKLDGIETTDSDGMIRHIFPPLAYGIYDVRYEVVGDATQATAQLWILPPATRLAVFDIDGTLTTSDFELVKELFYDIVDETYTPEAYPSAAELTAAVRDAGYINVYMTGRPYWLTRPTRKWLATGGFAPAPLFLAPTNEDALPTESGVGDYKLETLRGFAAAGFLIDWGHGNATTDIYAYLGFGLPKKDVFIIGKHAGEQGTVTVTGSWAGRTAEVRALPRITQPFQP